MPATLKHRAGLRWEKSSFSNLSFFEALSFNLGQRMGYIWERGWTPRTTPRLLKQETDESLIRNRLSSSDRGIPSFKAFSTFLFNSGRQGSFK